MIVRIATEGQYRLESAYFDQLNAIDNALVEAIAASDEARFKALLADMLDLVRQHGKPLPPEEFVESDVILPPPDTTFEEAKELFAGEGLIPG